jgi:hypothetical protein
MMMARYDKTEQWETHEKRRHFLRQREHKPTPNGYSTVSTVLTAVSDAIGFNRKVQELAVLSLWGSVSEQTLGRQLAQQTKAIKLASVQAGLKVSSTAQPAEGALPLVLWVQVANPLVASELGFKKQAVLEALNRFSPQTGIAIVQLQTKVALF